MPSAAIEYARANQARFLEELKELLRIPSVSAKPEHVPDMRRTAQLLAAELTRIGLEHAAVIDTAGHPLVYADWLHAAGQPTVLLYAHYDVQPAEPLELWTSPAFEPTERDGNLYARGVVDDKGQLHLQLKALESLLATGAGRLPVNVRIIFEGEEEVGSKALTAYLPGHAEQLKADVALVCDSSMFADGLPTLVVGLRGIVYTEVTARGAKSDLHSGMFGGAAPNALEALARVISQLKDAQGRILIPGFYDRVEAPSAAELAAWDSLPFDEELFRQHEIGSSALTGEPGYSVLYRLSARPTLEVHGIPGGYMGDGAKTVIPAQATAKISMRLVPAQRPDEVFEQYRSYVQSLTPAGIELEVKELSGADPVVVPTDNQFVRCAAAALQEVFGRQTVYIRGGGSIPIVADFAHALGLPSLLMGFGLPDDNLHAPNEKFKLANYYRGIESVIRWFELLGAA
jgi:acetylornithine deacetylase/succinyl-diaminopimelate desuccinylase-like protein